MAELPLPKKVFIVVDPSQDNAIALDRALVTAQNYAKSDDGTQPSLHVFLAVDMDTSAKNEKVRRHRDWFTKTVMEPLDQSGFEWDMELSWSSDWYGSIQKAAEACSAELILFPMAKKLSASTLIFNESVWRLLRTAPCPVLIVKPDSSSQRKKVLTAVNFQSHKPAYAELNDRVISRGRWMAGVYGAEMHVVNAYEDSLNYPDRTKLTNSTGVDSANIHVQSGDADEVISAVADKVDADIVVLGVRNRNSRWRGNTLEKIITKVNCDILAIHQS